MTMQYVKVSTPEADDALFVCGDVMTGRGIDQILPHPCSPELFEPYVGSALDYVALAERANGQIRRPVDFAYVWGDAIAELERVRPAARIANLETAITCADEPWPGKGIHYRMHPENTPCLTAAGIDCCVLANNHVLDWGYAGLADTLDMLRRHGRSTAGAGRDIHEALAHALIELEGDRRVLVFALGMESAGVPREWAATDSRAGVALMTDLSSSTVARIVQRAQAVKRPGDIVVLSVHWGDNWGYRIPEAHRTFAHRLIDAGAVDLVHGHSSHHPVGIEVYGGRPILYGCGDFLNDYEGIGGEERYRPDLTLMYFPSFDRSGRLMRFLARPMRICRFRLERTTEQDHRWLARMLTREGGALGTRAEVQPDGMLAVRWQ
jgi:poly-gamma-glutamate synthesis protein (capsule biosynthesis protein)